MTTATVAGLLAFINAQPESRPINHASYASCAIGDYAREELQHIIPDTRDLGVSYSQLRADPVMIALWQESGTCSALTASLHGIQTGDKQTLMDIMQVHDLPETYGGLADLVNNPGRWDDL